MAFPSMNLAAQHLGYYTSNLNLQINRPERDIGAKLIEPGHRYQPMQPTPRGRRLLDDLATEEVHALLDHYAHKTRIDKPGRRKRRQESTTKPHHAELALPHFWAPHEIRRLEDAAGRGYARLLASDPDRSAILMEALGPSISQLGWLPEQVIRTICETLSQAWRVELPQSAPAQTGRTKAQSLAGLVERAWTELDQPCSRDVIDTALRFAERREAAYSEERCVAVHGDPHAGNAMRVPELRPGAESGFVYVDPEAFVAEPAYDLGIVLRDWTTEFLNGSAKTLARHRCGLLAEHSGLNGDAIWEWGFLERIATGLYVLEFGAAWGQDHLDVAERLL